MDPEKSQLLNSLKAYLNNKTRLQPIIGLGTILECVNVSSRIRETLYLCEVCACRLTKGDMRNHIMGSHHRFNYIKARHPHLVSKWLESPDLSKMAWPLMELAKVLEKKEGPGHVQFFEVQDELYQMMATQSENHAVTLMKTLRRQRAELEIFSETRPLHYPVVSHRIVLPDRNQREHPEMFDRADMKSFQFSQQTESKAYLQNTSTPQLEKVQMLVEPSVELEDSGGFVHDFTGAKPLIGLGRVVEFRSEDGCSYCFLCHCCRIRSTKKDMIDHLTSSSHLVNYLMEIYPNQIEALGEVTEDNFQLQSLAARVEEEEGRGEMKVVNVPESICSQLTGKSYHWCLKILSSGGENFTLQQKSEAVIDVNKITARHVPEKISLVMSKRAKPMKKRKKKKNKTNTMFNVSLPLGEGDLLLERRSFIVDRSSSSKLQPITSPSEIVENGFLADNPVNPVDTESEPQTSQPKQHLYQEDAESTEYMPERHITITVFQDTDGFVDNQSGQNKPMGSQECSSEDWKHEGLQSQSGGLFVAGPLEEWSPYNSYYVKQKIGTDLWYSSASAGAREEALRQERELMEVNLSSVQLHQTPQPSWGEEGPHTDSIWEHQVVPYLKAARINMEPYPGHIPGCSISSDSRGLGHGTEPVQTHTEFTTDQMAPQCYTTPSTTFEVTPIQQRLMFYANHGALPWANPNFMHPVTDHGGGGWTQTDASMQPRQAVPY
ncbi:hypothetical protein XENOCAPTIV_030303 [Xenoophorus captivus]|uniref:C2H2-type domain-containing protein n=1 Tax=Xenoophorus captivus TaxID=1517983 RepID=A0ABV0Q6X1_9TELE